MKKVSILLLKHLNLSGLETARQGFLEANNYHIMKRRSPVFDVELVGNGEEVELEDGLYAIRPQRSIQKFQETDLLVIPPVKGDKIKEALRDNAEFAAWIAAQHQKGAEVASLCLGAFVLGASGLLDHKKCVTHWRAAEEFKALFPETQLLTDKIITDQDGIYTGGGSFSSANLILYLIEKMVDRETAIHCSKHFQIEMGRNSQSPFVIFNGQKNHGDAIVLKAQLILEQEYARNLSVDQLAGQLCFSRRTLERRFKSSTGNTISEYLQRVRVEAAKRHFEKGGSPVKEAMYLVGYSDAKFFNALFKKHVGLSPSEYRTRYSAFAPAS